MKPFDTERFKQDADGQWWYHYGQKHAGLRTRIAPQICVWCKEEFLPPYRSRTQRAIHCTRSCALLKMYAENPGKTKGEKGGRWKGGTLMNRSGYIMTNAPDHPSLAGTTRRYVLEHRLVMERLLGRPLLRSENVHHKNGIKTDNRPENLELWKKAQPCGARVQEQQHCISCTCFRHLPNQYSSQD